MGKLKKTGVRYDVFGLKIKIRKNFFSGKRLKTFIFRKNHLTSKKMQLNMASSYYIALADI